MIKCEALTTRTFGHKFTHVSSVPTMMLCLVLWTWGISLKQWHVPGEGFTKDMCMLLEKKNITMDCCSPVSYMLSDRWIIIHKHNMEQSFLQTLVSLGDLRILNDIVRFIPQENLPSVLRVYNTVMLWLYYFSVFNSQIVHWLVTYNGEMVHFIWPGKAFGPLSKKHAHDQHCLLEIMPQQVRHQGCGFQTYAYGRPGNRWCQFH